MTENLNDSGENMNELKLSQRLEKVANYLPENSIFADIGSDHAYLPCHAVLEGKAQGAIVGEITDGPFYSAQKQVLRCELSDVISVRKGDGLSVIEDGEHLDCITIAGMGGGLIKKILEEGKKKLVNVKRLVLQPNIHAIYIRQWLLENDWELIDETILKEDSKIYEILVAEKGDPLKPYQNIELQAGLLVGPILAKEKSPIFQKKWSHEINHWKTILKQLEDAGYTYENNDKYREVTGQLQLVQEVLS